MAWSAHPSGRGRRAAPAGRGRPHCHCQAVRRRGVVASCRRCAGVAGAGGWSQRCVRLAVAGCRVRREGDAEHEAGCSGVARVVGETARRPLVVESVVERRRSSSSGRPWRLAGGDHQRLWGPQPSRPLSWVVNPPSLQARMWSPWQWCAGDEAGRRARSGGARRRGRGAGSPGTTGPSSMSRTRLVPSATTRWISVSSWPSSSATAPGAMTVPAASSQARPAKVSKSTITVTRGAGRLPSAGAVRARVAISTRASGAAAHVVRARWAAVVSSPCDGDGGGPVGGEQLAFDALQGPVDRGGGHRGEVAVGMTDAVEADTDAEPAQVGVAAVALLGPVGVGGVAPVGAQALPVVEPQPAPLGRPGGLRRRGTPPGPGCPASGPGRRTWAADRSPGPERGPGRGAWCAAGGRHAPRPPSGRGADGRARRSSPSPTATRPRRDPCRASNAAVCSATTAADRPARAATPASPRPTRRPSPRRVHLEQPVDRRAAPRHRAERRGRGRRRRHHPDPASLDTVRTSRLSIDCHGRLAILMASGLPNERHRHAAAPNGTAAPTVARAFPVRFGC